LGVLLARRTQSGEQRAAAQADATEQAPDDRSLHQGYEQPSAKVRQG